MARARWVGGALLLVAFGALVGALLGSGDFGSTLVVPSMVPTLSLPAPPAATPSSEPLTPSPTVTSVRTRHPTTAVTRCPTAAPTSTPTPTPISTRFSLDPPMPIEVTPTLSDTTAVPTPVPAVEMAPGTINVVVLGSDRRPDWADWHTDAVHVVSVQPQVPAVTVLSIPRDLYVYIPHFWMARINFADMYGELYAYEGGGPRLLQQTLLYNLGIGVDHYVRTDFDGLIGIVDALGGVDIPVHCRLEDHWRYADENGEYPIKVLEPGIHHMDGETALWYARSRKTSSLFARERRQQQVLQAIWRRSRSLGLLTRIPELWGQLRGMVVTDMDLADVLTLAEVAFRLDEQSVRFLNIGYQDLIPWTTPKGGSVFLPNWEEVGPVVSEALGPIPEGRLWRALQAVEVWNGTGNVGWDQLAADRLLREGFVATIGQPDRRDYAQTQLIDFAGASKGSAIPYLQWLFGISSENVASTPDLQSSVAYRVIIGADYQTCRSP